MIVQLRPCSCADTIVVPRGFGLWGQAMRERRKSGGPGTVTPNGKKIRKLRDDKGWTFAELEFRTHIAVKNAALNGHDDGRFRARYLSRERQGRLAGVCTTALANAEGGRPVLAITLSIIALTFGVEVADLIA